MKLTESKLRQIIKEEIQNLNESWTEKSLKKKMDLANKYIKKSQKDNISAIETDSTWEEVYDFELITLKGNFIFFSYKEPYNSKKLKKERFSWKREDMTEDIKYMFQWVIKTIKKGYRSEGQKIQF
jgi:hypothetical protein